MHSVGQALQDYDRYEGLTDEEIVALAQDHDDQGAVDYLVEKYKNFVRARARSYFLMGRFIRMSTILPMCRQAGISW